MLIGELIVWGASFIIGTAISATYVYLLFKKWTIKY